MLIPDSESGHAIWVCESLKLKKVELHLMSTKKNPALKFFKNIKSFYFIESWKDKKEYVDEILKRYEKVNADIILPIGEPAINAFAKNHNFIKKTFSIIPIPGPETFKTATNKRKLAKFCEENGIPFPKTKSLVEIKKENDDLKFPLIAKPERGDGGKNIHMIFSNDELNTFLSSEKDFSMGDYLIQEYINGYDIDMSVLTEDGHISAFTIQKGFIERSNKFSASAGIHFLNNEKLYNTVEKLIKLQKFNGIAHIDLRYNNYTKEFMVVEMNVRFWGSLLGSTISGVNFPYLACLAGLGQKISKPSYKNIRYIDALGILKKPKVFYSEKINFDETNLPQIFTNPLAHVLNIIQRRNN